MAHAVKHLRAIGDTQMFQNRVRPTHDSPFAPFLHWIPLNPNMQFLQQKKGITVDTAVRFEAGKSCKNRFLQGTAAVRLHDMQGRPLGYCGRHLEPNHIEKWGKWRFPKKFPKHHILFNAHRAVYHRPLGCVLVECPWAVMRLAQAGFPGAVALLGTHLSSAQRDWVAKAPKMLVLLDGDDAGRRASANIATQLGHLTDVRLFFLPDGLEPEDLSDFQLALLVLQKLSAR